MPLVIDFETMRALGGKDMVDAQVAAFQQALIDHASTTDVPAPSAPNAIVEAIVRQYGGQYTAEEPPAENPSEDQPPSLVPGSITARQGKIMLLRMGLMTTEEAMSGAVPAFLSATMQNMKPEEAAELFLTWRDAATWYRTDPLFGGSLLAAAATALNQPATDEAVDQFFIAASAI